jgi:hypothetical protein
MFQGEDIWLMICKIFQDALWLRFTDSVQVQGLRLRVTGKA